MKAIRSLVLAAAALALASPLMAQDRGVVVQAFGGVYGHSANLSNAPLAHFEAGYGVGGTVGYQLNRHFSLNADFTFGRTDGLGAVPFTAVNRFIYGGELQARLPLTFGLVPFVYAGGGAVTIDEVGPDMPYFTKPAALFGAGFAFPLGQLPLELVAQGRGHAFRWDRNGYDKTQVDMLFVAGFRYRFLR